MRAQIGGDPEWIWNKLSYVEGLHACADWWIDYAEQRYRFQLSLRIFSNGRDEPERLEVLRLDSDSGEVLV